MFITPICELTVQNSYRKCLQKVKKNKDGNHIEEIYITHQTIKKKKDGKTFLLSIFRNKQLGKKKRRPATQNCLCTVLNQLSLQCLN